MSLAAILAVLDHKSTLTAEDALAVRRAVYADDMSVSPDEAQDLIRLNRDSGEVSPEWGMLYREALADYLVRQQTPKGYVDRAKAEWLIGALGSGPLKDNDLDALGHILETADSVPSELSAYALDQTKAAILARGRTIGADDVERLRKLVFALGGPENEGVTRDEAAVLFDLNDAFRGADNAPAWGDFFVRAIGSAMLFATVYHPVGAEQELRNEAFVADDSIHPLRFLTGLAHPRELLQVALRRDPTILDDWRDRVASDARVEAEAERVTSEEAVWLVDRIGRDGNFDANERALIRFLMQNASGLDAALQPLIARLDDRDAA